MLTPEGEDNSPFKFRKGDVIKFVDEDPEGTNKDDWAVGVVERTGVKGSFPLDTVYAVPCVERPPQEFLVSDTVCTERGRV